ncbi:class I SAM-dependent methyltransferase [Candidatus Parcubacteria bacterium]|nr:class I SAM-dependent methyltransferase [Candidatus Parcubacteria bacterium]
MNGFINPQQILKQLKLRKDMTAVDFGCGSGSWVLPLAEKLEDGKVIAIDILEEPLSALQGKAKIQHLDNIERVLADIEKSSKLEDGIADLVLMTDLLFEVDDVKKVLEEGKRVLKKGGRILVVDWRKDVALGPEQGRVLPSEIKKIAKDLGLKLTEEFEAGTYHFALVFEK